MCRAELVGRGQIWFKVQKQEGGEASRAWLGSGQHDGLRAPLGAPHQLWMLFT